MKRENWIQLLAIIVMAMLLLVICWEGRAEMATVTYQIITPDGVTVTLEGGDFRIYGLENIGPPGARIYSHLIPGQDGAALDDIQAEPRTVTVAQAVIGSDIADVMSNLATLCAGYRYNRTATIQPLKLRVTVDGTAADLYCYYGGNVVSKIDNVHALVGFTLIAFDPYWYATTETSTTGLALESLNVSFIMGRKDGIWGNLGAPSISSGGHCRAIAIDENDDLYVGATGANINSNANADYIAKYDVSAGSWSALGTGGNDSVYDLIIGPNGDLYAIGAFLSMGGVANTNAVARWDGSAWNALGAGGAGTVVAWCAVMDSQGRLYVGGNFSSMGGIANTAKIAMWDGSAWNALGAGLDDRVWGMAIDANDNLYVVGDFTGTVGGGTSFNRFGKWDGSSWSAVGGTGLNDSVYDVAVDSAGMIYLVGDFTTANGTSIARAAMWDGISFSPMGDGLDDTAYFIDIGPDDTVYVTGDFSTAGEYAVSGAAQWTGSYWFPVGIFFPSPDAVVYPFAWDSNDNLYVGFYNGNESSAFSRVVVPSDITVTNNGNVETPPTIEIEGSGTLTLVRNETSGVEVTASLKINKGETVTLDLGDPGEIPGELAVTSDWARRPNANNLLGKITTPTSLSLLKLVPAPRAASGQNVMSIFLIEPLDIGDNQSLVSGWGAISGLTTSNTDDYTLYGKLDLDADGDDHITLYLYKDSAMSSLVASAEWSGEAEAAISEENSSGLGGSIFFAAIPLGSEQLSNPGFETPGAGGADIWANWTEVAGTGALANETVNVNSGSDAAKLTAGAGADTAIYQEDTARTAGEICLVSFFAAGDGTNAGHYSIKDETNGTWLRNYVSTGVTSTTYAQVDVFVEVPAGCTAIRVYFWCPPVNGAHCFVDDASLKVLTGIPDSDIQATWPFVTVKHWDRYDSLWAAVS